MLGDKTTVMGVRLTDYQREKIKIIAKERGVSDTDYVRALIDNVIDGKIDLDTDVRSLKRIAKDKGIRSRVPIPHNQCSLFRTIRAY